jgi:hypothetical protein
VHSWKEKLERAQALADENEAIAMEARQVQYSLTFKLCEILYCFSCPKYYFVTSTSGS